MRHRGGRTVIQARWWNVGSRSRNAKGNAESDEQGKKRTEVRFCGGLLRSSVEVSVMDMERRGRHTQATEIIQLLNKEEDMMKEAKPFVIDKTLIYKAYLKVKENKGSAGVDSVSIEDYEKDLGNRLYKLWNRMS